MKMLTMGSLFDGIGGFPLAAVHNGGSPCQDLSVAGARAGIFGERSGLFMEQVRIVKEMRDADRQRGRAALYI